MESNKVIEKKPDKLVDNILSLSINLLEKLDIYNEMEIVYEYTMLKSNTEIKYDKDLNDFIYRSVIDELKKQYLGGGHIEFSNMQIEAMTSLNNELKKLDKSTLFKLKPEKLFYSIEEKYEPPFENVFEEEPTFTFRVLKNRLQMIFDFITELKVQGYNDKILKSLNYTLQDRIDLIEEVYTDSYRIVFSTKLNSLLSKTGLSQNRLAKLMGIRQATVSEWCLGYRLPSLPRVIEVAKYCNTSIDYLLRPDADESYLDGGYISLETGLSLDSINKMKGLKSNSYYSKYIAKLLDLLIHNYHDYGNDLLSEIADYLKPHYEKNLYLISDYELNSLADDIIEDCKDIKDVKDKIRDFTHTVETDLSRDDIYDVSNIQLQNILKVLVRIKDSIDK